MKLKAAAAVATIGLLGMLGATTAGAQGTDASRGSKEGKILCPASDIPSSEQGGKYDPFDIKDLEGKRLWQARVIAKRHKCVIRVTSRNGNALVVTGDYKNNRINVGIKGSKRKGWTVTNAASVT